MIASAGVAAAAGFALLARSVARRKTASVDKGVRKRTVARPEHPVRRAAEKAAPIGKWWSYLPAGGAAAAWVLCATGECDDPTVRSRIAGAAAIVGAGSVAALLNKRLDDILPQPPAPPGRPTPTWPVFPSGHAFGTATVALTAAYVLSRHGVVKPAVAYPAAYVVPLVSSVARMIEDKHWLSDVVGGHLAAVTVGCLALAAYETARE